MSSSLAWYSEFSFSLVNCKFYLKINTVPNSLLHSASAVLGLIGSLSVLPGRAVKGAFLKVQLVSEGCTPYLNPFFSKRITFILKSFHLC